MWEWFLPECSSHEGKGTRGSEQGPSLSSARRRVPGAHTTPLMMSHQHPGGVLTRTLKQIKHILFRRFFFIFFLFYKNMHTYTRYGGFWRRHTHTHTRARVHARIHTNTLPWTQAETPKALRTSGVASPSPCLSTLPPHSPSVKLVLRGAAVRAEGGGTPETEGSNWGQCPGIPGTVLCF